SAAPGLDIRQIDPCTNIMIGARANVCIEGAQTVQDLIVNGTPIGIIQPCLQLPKRKRYGVLRTYVCIEFRRIYHASLIRDVAELIGYRVAVEEGLELGIGIAQGTVQRECIGSFCGDLEFRAAIIDLSRVRDE